MPSTCAVVGCAARSDKCPALKFFSVKRDDKTWTAELVAAINRSDKSFKIANARICSRHFEANSLEPDKDNEFDVSLKHGSLPTKFMPQRSCQTTKSNPRKPPKHRLFSHNATTTQEENMMEIDMSDPSLTISNPPSLKEILEVISRDLAEKWHILNLAEDQYDVIEYHNMKVLKCLQLRKAEDAIYGTTFVGGTEVCCTQLDSCNEAARCFKTLVEITPCPGVSGSRSDKCAGVVAAGGSMCSECKEFRKLQNRKAKRSQIAKRRVVSMRTPLTSVTKGKLSEALKTQRKISKALKRQIAVFKKRIATESVPVTDDIHNSLNTIMSTETLTSPLVKTFWEEQKKNFTRPAQGRRWHPAMIRLALLLHSESPLAYRTLKESGVLCLPGESTLKDFTNYVAPSQGFQPEIVDELRQKVSDWPEEHKFVALVHDEMTLKEDLVYNERTGELCGLVFGSSGANPALASHVLVFMVLGLVGPTLKFTLGYFGTRNAGGADLYPLFWKAVYILERVCGLKVIASTSDKSAPNMKMVNMHGESGSTRNWFAAEERQLFFISDAPHLLKTLRNNLHSSASRAKATKYFWNNGTHLLWDHVERIFKEDSKSELRKTKLQPAHVYLTPHSKMNVLLAAQVMSSSVANVMMASGDESVKGTAKFLGIVDRLFDCLNTRSEAEAVRKKKPDLMPYESTEDPRLKFMEEEVITYLDEWKSSVDEREEDKCQKQRMFLTPATYKGVLMTVRSMCGAIRYLLAQGVKRVYTRRFTQDALEAHFGRQRGLGRRCDNPTLYAFGYSENKLRIQRSVSSLLRPKGNVQADTLVEITSSPMKRKRKN